MWGVKEESLVVSLPCIAQSALGRLFEDPFYGMMQITVSSCPRVNLAASLTSKAMASIIMRHGGHPEATGSSLFQR